MNLTDLLSGSVISSIAGQTGTSEKDTRNVLASALPALVGAMAQNASTEEGAESLARALDDHTTAEGLSGLLGKVDTEDGAKILTKILGGQNDAVQKAVAEVAAQLGTTGRILVRESGTEPVIRVMVEAESKVLCQELVDRVVEVIRATGHGV